MHLYEVVAEAPYVVEGVWPLRVAGDLYALLGEQCRSVGLSLNGVLFISVAYARRHVLAQGADGRVVSVVIVV